jgi:hypothetical protein
VGDLGRLAGWAGEAATALLVWCGFWMTLTSRRGRRPTTGQGGRSLQSLGYAVGLVWTLCENRGFVWGCFG